MGSVYDCLACQLLVESGLYSENPLSRGPGLKEPQGFRKGALAPPEVSRGTWLCRLPVGSWCPLVAAGGTAGQAARPCPHQPATAGAPPVVGVEPSRRSVRATSRTPAQARVSAGSAPPPTEGLRSGPAGLRWSPAWFRRPAPGVPGHPDGRDWGGN